MATMGLKYLAWAKLATEPDDAAPTYDAGIVIGKAVSTSLSVKNSEGKLYADDALAEYVSEFSSADFSAEADNISLENQGKLYGVTYTDSELQFAGEDTAPYGAWGGYQVLSVQGVRKYRAHVYYKGKASIPDWSGATKGESISLGTEPIKATMMQPKYGPWRTIKEFSTESAAKAYVDAKLGVATWYAINVQVQGAEGTEAASPVGTTSAANGGTFELAITGTVTKLYDNGTDVTANVSGGKYTLTDVAAAHNIAVIF
jgi:nitrous oxide reductase accessory protein NosL